MKKLFACLLCITVSAFPIAVFSQQQYPVYFSHGTEFFPENIKNAAALQPAQEEIVNGVFVRYIQFASVLKNSERELLQKEGVQILGYVNFAAYLLAFPEHFDLQKLETFHARSIVQPEPAWKMHKNLKERPLGEWAVQGNQVDITIQVYSFIPIEEGAALCRKAGYTVLETGKQNGYLLIRTDQDELENTAAMPFIQWLELKPAPGQKEDINGRSLHRANLLDSDHPLGKKFNGEGVGTLVRDDGAVGPHIDFKGRLYNQNSVDDAYEGNHGDGVAGIIGGSGNLDPTKKGMAAGANVFVIDYANHFQDETMLLFLNQNVTITNSSYSDGCNQGYTLASQTVDNQIYENPTLMHVFSAGNSNSSDCGYGAGDQWGNITGGHKMAKNAIATANLQADADLESTSSRGPAYDGRIKPDISAHGANQNSTDLQNTYQVFGGTSAAAPGIAGCLAQLTQAYRTINNTPDAPTALLKATMLNTANELGNEGPDFKFGWGHVNNYRALQLLEEGRYLNDQIDQDGQNIHTVTIPEGIKEAKLMIYWVDPEAQSNAAMALLNDIDLTVKGPDGTSYLPWKLNPTPNAGILDTPAGVGRDSLNNMEQVSLKSPVSGSYTVNIAGFSIPFGPQKYYLVWEFLTEDVKITYPSGGEGLVSSNTIWVRWDALGNTEPFILKYSVDGGSNYTTIAELNKTIRSYNWQVPANIFSSNLKLALIRGNQNDTTLLPISVSPLPSGLTVQKVCPESVTLAWNKINNDTIAYDVYRLGGKYMEIQGTTPPFASAYTFPIVEDGTENWFSIRAGSASGLTGRRTIAIRWPGGLTGCSQTNDLAVVKFKSPADGALIACGEFTKPVTVLVENEGLTTSSGAKIWYQYQTQPVIQEDLPDIPAGGSLEFTFNTPITFSANGLVSISTGIIFQEDTYQTNNEKTEKFGVVVQTTNNVFTNTFETTNLPNGWLNVNPDESLGWERLGFSVTGSAGNNTRTYWINHFNYQDAGQEDYLYLIPVTLTNIDDPILLFDYAHAQLNNLTSETLRLEAFPDCNLSAPPVVLWEKTDPQLATIVTGNPFTPADISHWNKEAVSLEQFAGQTVVLRFAAVNGHGNNTYLDNIALKNLQPIEPVASFSMPDTICRSIPVSVSADPGPGSENVYSWLFGSLATPPDATGPGPHEVTYLLPGNKTIRLIVENPFGSDTTSKTLNVRANPVSNFTQTLNGLTATFNNTSQNATGYLWNFGDGNTSTLKNPVHTFSTEGTYNVTLSAINPCKTTDKTLPVSIINGTIEQTGLTSIAVSPNPNNGFFQVTFNSPSTTTAFLTLTDAAGKLIGNKNITIQTGTTVIPFEYGEMTNGNYQLSIQTPKGVASLGIVVIK